MRKHEKQITDPAALEDVLARAQFCRIAMCDGDVPYVVPVCFGYEPGALYFHCAPEGRKLDILRANPKVCFQADVDAKVIVKDEACACTAHYTCVIGTGTAAIVEDVDGKRHALDVLMRHYTDSGGGHEYPENALGKTAVVRIDVTELVGKQSPAPSAGA